MDNAEKALMMAFGIIVLVIALGLAMFMFSKVTAASENMAFFADSTLYYDNVVLTRKCAVCNIENPYFYTACQVCKTVFPDITVDEDIKNGTTRIVGTETIIPTLYRYYKENFCVKIYDASDKLIQIFDVKLEGKVHGAAGDTHANDVSDKPVHVENNAYNKIYNIPTDPSIKYGLFGAPWLGSTEAVKTRIDYFVEGKAGYINNTYVDYYDNQFYKARKAGSQFKERFINYSYTGQTMVTDDGEELVTGEKSKDKIVIIYTEIH